MKVTLNLETAHPNLLVFEAKKKKICDSDEEKVELIRIQRDLWLIRESWF